LRQSRQGMATEVSGCLTALTEVTTYRTEERLRLLEYLEKTLPDIMRQLTPAARLEVQTRLNQMVADRSLEPLQAALRDLQKKVANIPEQQHLDDQWLPQQPTVSEGTCRDGRPASPWSRRLPGCVQKLRRPPRRVRVLDQRPNVAGEGLQVGAV